MAVSPGVRLVALGSPLVTLDADGAAVAAALADAGVGLESRTVVDEDEAALERVLTPAAPLTVLVAGPGGSTGDVTRRVLARVTGARPPVPVFRRRGRNSPRPAPR